MCCAGTRFPATALQKAVSRHGLAHIIFLGDDSHAGIWVSFIEAPMVLGYVFAKIFGPKRPIVVEGILCIDDHVQSARLMIRSFSVAECSLVCRIQRNNIKAPHSSSERGENVIRQGSGWWHQRERDLRLTGFVGSAHQSPFAVD